MQQESIQQLALFNRLCKELDDLYRVYAIKIGISTTEFWILYTLFISQQPFTQHMLSELWFYPKQTIHSAIHKLVKSDLVILHASTRAGHCKDVALTDAGKQFCLMHIHPLVEAENDSFFLLSTQERTQFLHLFQKQITGLRDHLAKT